MKYHNKLLAMTQTAMLTAVLAVTAQIAVPLPSGVPLTLQCFGVALCAILGGVKKGIPALLLYLAAGAAGLPVFANFRGGAAMLLDYTGGFLWGFLPLAFCCAVGGGQKKPLAILLGCVGLCLCHACGILQYMAVSGMGLRESILLVSVPYLLKDLLCIMAAFAAAIAVRRAVKAAGFQT